MNRMMIVLALLCCIAGLIVSVNGQDIARSSTIDFQSYRSSLAPNTTARNSAGRFENIGRCGSYSPNIEERLEMQRQTRQWLDQFGAQEKNHTIITIPVAFHIITHANGVTGNVTDQQIFDQIDTLNSAFANTNFRFSLNSIDRTANTNWFNDNDEVGYKSALSIDVASTLNFYTNSASGFLGYAYLPSTFPEDNVRHGVVILHSSMPGGTSFPYDEGDTGTHEIGHYLGLLHTFDPEPAGCTPPGDLVDDTPYEASPAFGCPIGRDTCPAEGLDPIHNFMDYVDDACMNELTPGQSQRMDEQVAQFKPTLLANAAQTFMMSVTDGWNMISLPYEPDEPDYATHYPNAIASPFYFDGAYVGTSTLNACTGYWLNNSATEIVPITGGAINSCVLNLNSGWNLIGGPSCDVAVAAIDDPGNIINGTIFGWNGAYSEAATIAQGQAYWINASSAGTITITCASSLSKAPQNMMTKHPDLSREKTIEISDAQQNRQQLYFGIHPETGTSSTDFHLPPIPPSQLFDARFANESILLETDEADIKLQSGHFPLTINARNIQSEQGIRYVLKAYVGSIEVSLHSLSDAEKITISDSRVNTLKLLKISDGLPTAFSLDQNYPNPFNPATEIQFGLPNSETVKITIFNTLGQKIKTVLDERRDAGFHTVSWDATNDIGQPVASGVYLYGISAGNFSQIKKMIYLR